MGVVFKGIQSLGGNGVKGFHCIQCLSFISSSDLFLKLNGAQRHSFVNPEGIYCEFYSFHSCPGAVPHGRDTEQDSWFPGYAWTPAFCVFCGNHLGWHYRAVSVTSRPMEFWGILMDQVSVR